MARGKDISQREKRRSPEERPKKGRPDQGRVVGRRRGKD